MGNLVKNTIICHSPVTLKENHLIENIHFIGLDSLEEYQAHNSQLQHYFVLLDDLENIAEWEMPGWKAAFQDFYLKVRDNNIDNKVKALSLAKRWEHAKIAGQLGLRELLDIEDLLKINQETHTNEKLEKPSAVTSTIPFPIKSLEGNSPSIKSLRQLIRKVAPLETTLLIQGATGTGKDLVALEIHKNSPRSPHHFTVVDCAHLSEELFESKLFGHKIGAFTGAIKDTKGLFDTVAGGTLFLNEVSLLSAKQQSKLLRVLQERTYTPVGSQEEIALNARIISSSTQSIESLISKNLFRQDLYYRLQGFEIFLPSLKERKKDIVEISKSILRKEARKNHKKTPKLSEELLELFYNYNWPGNIRELESVLIQSSAFMWADNNQENIIKAQYCLNRLQSSTSNKDNVLYLKKAVRSFEKTYIENTLKRLGGDKEQTAETLGLSLASLYRKMAI